MSGDKQKLDPEPQPQGTTLQGYVDRIIARAKELEEADAFAAPLNQVGSLVSAAQARATTSMHHRNSRRITIAFALAMALTVILSLCLPYYGASSQGVNSTVYDPGTVVSAWILWFKMNVLIYFDGSLSGQKAQMLSQFAFTYGTGVYTLVTQRAAVTFLCILCGIMLALSGMLFQTSFRNPLAAPTMLGVSDGMTLGCIIYAFLGYTNISNSPGVYAALVYGLGALAVVVVLGASRLLSGGKRYSVMDMLLLGTVVCQFLGGVSQFVQNFVMSDDEWANFYDIQQATNAVIEPFLQVIVVLVFIVTFAIVFILRFRLNLVAFTNDEGAMMGSRTGVLRGVALVVGSLMQLAALATLGQIAMLSMAVPFLVRYLMPADFKSQFLGNCLVGSTLLLICLVLQHFIVIGMVTPSLGAIVSVLVVPFFIWVVTFAQGKWS